MPHQLRPTNFCQRYKIRFLKAILDCPSEWRVQELMWNDISVWLPKHFNCLISPTSTNSDSTLFAIMVQPDPSGQYMNILLISHIQLCIAWYWIVKEMGTYQKAVWWDLQDSPSQCPPPGSCVKLHQIKANMALLGIFGSLCQLRLSEGQQI